jgi:hypothetical protein
LGFSRPELVGVQIELLHLIIILEDLGEGFDLGQSYFAIIKSKRFETAFATERSDKGLTAHPREVVMSHEQLSQSIIVFHPVCQNGD